MNTTKKFLFVLVLVTMLTGFFPGSALAAPSGKRRPAGWYHHILGNGNCKDKNWQPYGPPVKNKEWKKGQCPVTTPAPSPVPTTPGPNPIPIPTPVPAVFNQVTKIVTAPKVYSEKPIGTIKITFIGYLSSVRACKAGTTNCVWLTPPNQNTWKIVKISQNKYRVEATLYVGTLLEPGKWSLYGFGPLGTANDGGIHITVK